VNTVGVVSNTPSRLTNPLLVPARTVSPEDSEAVSRSRPPATRDTASTSEMVIGDTVGALPKVTLPGTTSSRLAPSPWTCDSTSCLAPVPMATSTTTAATPITTPSMVSPLRNRLARKPSSATRHASASLMTQPR
jgi:hypothetical protein